MGRLDGRRVAVLIEDAFEDAELVGPRDLLRHEGADVVIVGPKTNVQYVGKKGLQLPADVAADTVSAREFDAVVVPGGYAPDKMRMRHAMVDLVRDAVLAGKPVAAICHGPQVLISADVLRGRTVTCWPSIAIDVRNAGALYVDRPVVEDANVITSRKPDDIPQFAEAIIRALAR